jgi:hypothetical protein
MRPARWSQPQDQATLDPTPVAASIRLSAVDVTVITGRAFGLPGWLTSYVR